MEIRYNATWPGRDGIPNKWDDLREAVSKLSIDGPPMRIDLENPEQVQDARKAAQNYAHNVLGCKEGNWFIQTTSKGNTLYLRMVRR